MRILGLPKVTIRREAARIKNWVMIMKPFTGLSAFPLTPVDAQGRIDETALGNILERIVASGADSIGLLGSTGTYAYLSTETRKAATRLAVEVVAGRTPLIIGVGAMRTDTATALATDAKEAGADALLMAPVSYTPLFDAEVFAHYTTVADATDLPLCIYNNPSTTHFTFTTELLTRLARHPRIAAVKMPLPKSPITSDLPKLRAAMPRNFSIGYSSDWGAGEAMQAGADAFYSSVGGTIPDVMVPLVRAAMRHDYAEVERLNDCLQPLWTLCRKYGSLRVSFALARLLGLIESDPPLPLQALEGDEYAQTEMAMSALNI